MSSASQIRRRQVMRGDPKAREDWGVWRCDDAVHVAPLAGRRHEMSMGCWCLPHLDPQEPGVVIHDEAEPMLPGIG